MSFTGKKSAKIRHREEKGGIQKKKKIIPPEGRKGCVVASRATKEGGVQGRAVEDDSVEIKKVSTSRFQNPLSSFCLPR